jgi:peptide/nickel transport system ATP-binding protein
MTLIFVTHDMGVAAEISDRVAVMYAGRFIETGSAEQVLVEPRHPYTRAMLGSTVHGGMRGQVLQTIKGAPPDLRNLPKGCGFAPRCPLVLPACTLAPPPPLPLKPGHTASCLRLAAPAAVN